MYLVSCRVCTLLSPLQALRPGCGAGGLSHASVRTDGASGPVGGSVAGSDAVLADGAADEEAANGAVAAAATCGLESRARGSPAGTARGAKGVDSRRGAALPGTGAAREQREMHHCVRATRRALSSRLCRRRRGSTEQAALTHSARVLRRRAGGRASAGRSFLRCSAQQGRCNAGRSAAPAGAMAP